MKLTLPGLNQSEIIDVLVTECRSQCFIDNPSMGAASVHSLSSIAIMDPKLGVPLLLIIMFYTIIFRRNDVNCHDMLLKVFEMLPSLASHSAMIPLVVQTILPMLNKDAKV
ncbi:hypothetical protein ACSQ67_014502 [Phaseolus vulgaris]